MSQSPGELQERQRKFVRVLCGEIEDVFADLKTIPTPAHERAMDSGTEHTQAAKAALGFAQRSLPHHWKMAVNQC